MNIKTDTQVSIEPSAPRLAAVTAEAITKIYKSGDMQIRALDGVSLDIPARQLVAIMGPSGSGKSTLLHCLAGLDSVSSGRVTVGDVDLTGLSDVELTRLRRDRIGFVFQSFNLMPMLTAWENIMLPFDLRGGSPTDTEWIDRLVDTLGLRERLDHHPSELSGGQQQRVAVARALATRPQIVFADEPTGNLDSHSSAELLEFLSDAVWGLDQTIAMVTHDPIAATYATEVLFLLDGRLVDRVSRPTREEVLERLSMLGDGGRRS
ncbi:MAG: ABC transporter ATP-binding protein [Solirubrobacteraceae bacterium]